MHALADGAILACRLPEGGASLGLKQPCSLPAVLAWQGGYACLEPCRFQVTAVHLLVRLLHLQLRSYQTESCGHIWEPAESHSKGHGGSLETGSSVSIHLFPSKSNESSCRWCPLGLQVARRRGFTGLEAALQFAGFFGLAGRLRLFGACRFQVTAVHLLVRLLDLQLHAHMRLSHVASPPSVTQCSRESSQTQLAAISCRRKRNLSCCC